MAVQLPPVGLMLLILTVSLVLLRPSKAGPTTQPAVDNPHWKATGCAACHETDGSKLKPIGLEQTDQICLKCHDGKLARAEDHPIECVLNIGPNMKRPDGWPLIDQKLRCVTCHDTQFACDIKSHSRSANPNFLRGDHPREDQVFCATCHVESAVRQVNPHLTLVNGKVNTSTCLVCHTRVLDRATTQPTGEAALRGDEVTLCRDCHRRHHSVTTENHIGLRLSPTDLAFMCVREKLDAKTNPSKQQLADALNEGGRPAHLSAARSDVISCTTCHNPHQQGLFPKSSPIDFESLEVTKDQGVKSPFQSQQSCQHCHPM